LAAGVGGAVAGAGFGAINPRGQRSMEFDERVRPQIAQRWQFEDMDRAQRVAEAKAALEDMAARTNIANTQSQIQSRQAGDTLNQEKFDFERNQPMVLQPGATAYNTRTGQAVFTAQDRPKQPSAAELTIDPESGMSVEEMADASYNERGGDRYVYDRLPERTRRILESEPGTFAPEEVSSAARAYSDAINRQQKTDLGYTRGVIRRKNLTGQRSRPSSQPSGHKRNINELPPLTRQRSDFNSAKFP
jgi:hypothetical protein